MENQASPKKGKKRVGKIVLITALSLVAAIVLYLVFIIAYHSLYSVTPSEKIDNSTDYVVASGKALYDKNGDHLLLRGTNAGNWLVCEGWLGVTSIGNYTVNEEGKYSYGELSESELLSALENNKNLVESDADIKLLRSMLASNPEKYWWYEADSTTSELLLDWYYSNWWEEQDFVNIKELGLNAIRLPFHYRNLMEGDDEHLVMRKNAFKWLDWFVANCAKNEIYCILDCHGAVGSQNGYEHSGKIGSADFWKNETYIEEMCGMWKNIATHYMTEQAELGKWIAAYDLLNEPAGNTTATDWTTREEWDILARLYDAVREADDKHCVAIGACWSLANSPNPKDYDFTNVLYEQHWYNWGHETLSYELFYLFQDLTLPFTAYDVPVLMGEFNFFDERADWERGLEFFEKRNYSWTTWTYKAGVVGSWSTSWGLYAFKMNESEQTDSKVDASTCTAAEIIKIWGAVSTSSPGYNADWFTAKELSEDDRLPYTAEKTNETGNEKTYDFVSDYITSRNA